MLDQKLSRHRRDPCPAEHHRDREGQDDNSRDDPAILGPIRDSREEEHYYGSTKGACLVQKRQLLRSAFLKDLSRRLSNEVRKRSGQMRLIEIPSLLNGVEDRDTLL